MIAVPVGLYLAWQFGSDVGRLLGVPPLTVGWAPWIVGAFVTLLSTVLIGRLIDTQREHNPGGSSWLSLYLRGLGWRAFARVIWAGVIVLPVAGLYWIVTSGILQEVLR